LVRVSLEAIPGERGGTEPLSNPPRPDIPTERPGMMVGRYKLLQQIGEGGFGVVFMAEQTEPVQRKVALKIIKAGMDTREVIARFEAERQALALMDHPNIARVLDAGTTEAQRPFFIMELVRGMPITSYCDENNLSARERLELFIKVCRAIQHAHQKGVIHRDLKPGNVLVTLHDGEPVPKVIDFGVAKALGQKLTEKTLFTRFEQMIGTPAYMSPEQAALSGLDIDTRSDIYSLGVLLYELLTGVTPLDAEMLRKGAFDEIRRMIRETDPPKPSTRLLALGDRLTEVAKHRDVEPAALSRLIRGDLDWITMKALEKDRSRRYDTAGVLAQDVECHFKDETVTARPPSAAYLLSKFLRRHRQAVTVAILITFAILAGVAVATMEHAEKRRASEHAAIQSRLLELKISLQRAIDDREYKESEAIANECVTFQEKVSDKESLAVGEALSDLGTVLISENKYTEANGSCYRALIILRRWLKPNDPRIAKLLGQLALAARQRGKLDEAESYYTQQLAIQTDWAELNLASIKEEEGQLSAAEELYRRALEWERRSGRTNGLMVAHAFRQIASVLERENKLAQAEDYYYQYLQQLLSKLPEDHIEVVSAYGSIASVLLRQNKFSEAEDPASKCLFGWEERGPDDWSAFYARTLFGVSLLGQTQYNKAEHYLLTGFEGLKRREDHITPPAKQRMDEIVDRTAKLFEETGRPDKAVEWRQKLADFRQSRSQKPSVNQSNGVVNKP
jgi:serine/threonine protein kinase